MYLKQKIKSVYPIVPWYPWGMGSGPLRTPKSEDA